MKGTRLSIDVMLEIGLSSAVAVTKLKAGDAAGLSAPGLIKR